MSAVLEVYDERLPGAKRELRHRLELPADRITARDLIRCRIETEVALHNAAEKVRLAGESASHDAGRTAHNAWLVLPGSVEQTLNGPRGAYGPSPGLKTPRAVTVLESEPLIAVATEAFERNGFFMIFDGRQITDLDDVLTVHDDSTATFIRLIPLVGG